MEQDLLNEIIEQSPGVDPTALERRRRIDERLAAVGIKLGGSRLPSSENFAALMPS